ncbi:MAG: hypothetical protein PVJ53_13295 [Desulfobacterales bacterium]|jgi:hypothetical protein
MGVNKDPHVERFFTAAPFMLSNRATRHSQEKDRFQKVNFRTGVSNHQDGFPGK